MTLLLNAQGEATPDGVRAVEKVQNVLKPLMVRYLELGATPQEICHLVNTTANYIAGIYAYEKSAQSSQAEDAATRETPQV